MDRNGPGPNARCSTNSEQPTQRVAAPGSLGGTLTCRREVSEIKIWLGLWPHLVVVCNKKSIMCHHRHPNLASHSFFVGIILGARTVPSASVAWSLLACPDQYDTAQWSWHQITQFKLAKSKNKSSHSWQLHLDCYSPWSSGLEMFAIQQTANPIVFQNPSASPASVFHEYQSLKWRPTIGGAKLIFSRGHWEYDHPNEKSPTQLYSNPRSMCSCSLTMNSCEWFWPKPIPHKGEFCSIRCGVWHEYAMNDQRSIKTKCLVWALNTLHLIAQH